MEEYKVFVSHGSHDSWLAAQIAKEIRAVGGSPFLDETSIAKGSPDLRRIIRAQIASSRELIALFTPWSFMRSWVWIEMGAAWNREIPIIAVFYGMEADQLDHTGQGKAILEDINVIKLNDMYVYLTELAARIVEWRK